MSKKHRPKMFEPLEEPSVTNTAPLRNWGRDRPCQSSDDQVLHDGTVDLADLSDPLAIMEAEETAANIADHVDRLSARQREVFELCAFEGLDFEDVAESLSITEATAREHYRDALRALKEMADEDAP